MPENKKYLIEIPGQEGVAYWGEERYNANKDALLKDHPDAIIAEVGMYSAEDARDNDEYIINIPGKSGSAHWDSQRFNANRDNLLKDFPNAQIQRVRPIDYWEEQRTDLNKRLEEHNAQYGSFLSEYEDKREMERARGLMGDTMRNTPESEYILENAREYGIRNKEREALLKALHENPREQQRKQNLHDSIDEMFAALEQEGNDSYKAALNQYIAEGGNIAAPGADAVISDKAENGLYNGALRFLESAKKTLEAPSKFDSSNGFLNFMKGAGHTFGSPDFWTFGLTSIVDNLEARDAFEKIWGKFKTVDINELSVEDIEQMLTPGEKALVEAFTKKAMADAERANDLSLGYQSGMTSAESLGFMAQFILTGGVTSSAAKGATKWAAKGLARGFGNLARQGVSKGMMNAIRGAGKFALGTTRSLIDAAVRTGITTTAPKSISEQLLPNIQQNTLPEANVAILKGLGDAFIENWSESYGEILGSVFKAPMNALFPEWSKAIARTPFMQVAERAGFNGYLTEIGEEWFGNAMRTLTNVDPDALKDFATVDNQIVTMTAFLPMTLIGGGVSMGQRRAAEKDLENKTANLRYTLEKAGLNMDEIDALVDYRQSLSPQMLSDRFTPLINRIAQMPGNRALAAELFKSAGHFSNAVARYQAMEGGYQVEENNAKNELRDEMVGNMNGNRFWNTRQSNATNENGEAYEFDEVQVVTRNDGSRFFIMGQAGDQLSTIDENGAIGYTTEEELNQQFEQGIIASNRTMMLDQFLSEDVIARRREVEAKRMSEQRATQIDEIRANNPIGTAVNLGTRVNPLAGLVVRYEPGRVIIQTENQENPFVSLSYEQFAQALNTPIRVLNDEQMAAEEAALIEAERAERETEQADTPDDMTVAEESTHSAVELEEEAAPSVIPMNEDGSVDEAKFLEEHPEEYVAWNDNNMQDGGADSREQLQMLIPVYQNMYNEAAKNWAASAANPVARRAAKASMAEWQEKIDRINNILAQYNMPTQENQPLAERTIQAELEDLHDGSLNDNEIISNIDAHIAEAQAAYDEYAKTAPVMGTDRQAYKQAKAEYEEGLKGLQQELDYWNEVKKANERYGQMMQQAEYEAMEARRIEAIKARIAEIAQRIGAGVNVIERPEDVMDAAAKREIEEGRPPLGWYNVTTGKVDLYLPGIPSAQMAEETIMHEVVGHKGLRGLLGEDSFGGLCDAVWDYMKSSLSKREQDFWLMYPGVNGDTRKAADEYMAHIAESVDFSEDRSVWDKIIGFIKDALRKIGIGVGVNDDYIIDMLKRSYANLRDNAETAPATSEEFLEENGFEVDETNDDIRLSSRYTTTDAREGELISAIVDVTGRSKDDAERWLQSEKSAASIVLADKQYLDYIPDDRYKAIKDNSDYPQGTVDFNNICRKRVSFTKMFTRLQRRFPNRVFTADDLADIRTIMSNDGLTVACGLCYVEDRRQMVGEVASFFIDQMQKNFEDYTYEVSAKDFAAGKMKRKKLSKDKVKKAAKYVVLIGNDTYVPSVYDLTTLEGLDKLYREHRGIWEAFQAFNSDRGQQSQNLFQGYAEYKREILDWSDAKVKKVNSLGGLRVFSYSDFEAHHLLDLIQIIIDCAARGVMIQGYTKVPEFARAVAQTGIKLNRSLIPLGDTGIVDGKLAFDPIEGIDVNDPNFLESNDNVGNILIGINDEQIRLAMADPFVHYIIPYHARQAEGIRAKLKVGNWSNYIDVQNERNISDGKRVKKGINIYTDVLNESITNDRQFVERYLEVCKEKGYIPKFDQFLNKDSEGNYIYTPGYHKFLVDFKLFDEAGNILPQKPVVAEFDDTFNMQILKDYAKGERVSTGEQMNTTYDKIVEALRLNEEEAEGEDIRFKTAITPKMDAEYMAAVEAGDMETARRMVDEAAEAAGYTIRGEHGRVSKFNIFDRDKANPEGDWGKGFYFTNNKDDVENNYASVEGPDLEAKIEREVERRVNLAEMNAEFNEDGEVDEFAIREEVENEFITSEPNVVHAAIKMDNPFVVGHGMVEIGEDGLGHYDMQETYLTAEYETDEDGDPDYSLDPTGTLVDLVEALNEELSQYEGVNINAYDILSDNIDGMTASQFEKEARELLGNSVDYLQNDDLEIMTSEIIRAAIERAGFDGIVDNTVNQKFGTARRFGRAMEGVNENTRHYIAFQSSQIKEADPVTYDDAGNVIPLSERFKPESEDIRFRFTPRTDEQREQLFDKAKEHYGLTNNFNASGYMLPDGSLLDFSEANDGGDPNQRSLDHRDIEGVIMDEGREYDSRWMYLADFMNEGAIRLLPESAGINLMKAPTKEQRQRLMDFIYKYNGEVILEIADERLNNVAYMEYDRRTSPSRIFRDIDGYFNEGIVPQQNIMFSTANRNQTIFVSNAAKAVEGIKMEKATPEQWLKMIEKNGGLKAGEDKWMGLSDWLKASDKKTLTKQEVLDFINEHMIIIEEQHYSNEEMGKASVKILNEKYQGWEDAFTFEWDVYMDEPNADISEYEAAVELYNKHHDDKVALDEDGEFEDMDTYEKVRQFGVELSEIYHGSKSEVRPIDGTREEYTTNGLTNLHEIALTVPTIESWNESDDIHFGDAGDGRAVAWIRFGETEVTVQDKTQQRLNEIYDRLDELEMKVSSTGITEEEYNERARLRRERDDLQEIEPKTQRVLVIDEIQSKRHQEGREKGYRVSDIEQWLSDNNVEVVESGEFYEFIKNGETDRRFSKGLMNYDIEKAKRLYVSGYNKSDIPDAPFDKNWHELAMKRMLRYAAENGYDVIAWTKGEQQADRYNLGKIYNEIEREDNPNIEGRTFSFSGGNYDKVTVNEDGVVVDSTIEEAKGKSLSDLVGKDLAVKMMSLENYDTIDEEDLRIGGEGMKGFYDRMLPAFMNKYGKKWGVKVEDIELPNLEDGLTMHSIPVTEEMKVSVMEGQVMFSTKSTTFDSAITPEVRKEMDVISAQAIVNGNYLKAPNGKNTKLTPEQWALVRTKNFINWFGDWINDPESASKVVDENGEPMVVYHGTPRAGFTEFKGGWFTTSKEDAISYSGDRKGRLFDPNEEYVPETLTAGDYRLGYMTFDSEEDRADFLKRFPTADTAMSERDYEAARLGADEEYDELTARRKGLKKIWDAYREYERERFVDSTIGDILDSPESYTEEDIQRAMLAYDSNASMDSLDETVNADERKDMLIAALAEANKETEGGIRDIKVETRVPRNGEGVKHNDSNRRTYEVYANIQNPYEVDANGRGSEFVSGDIYKAVEDALADEQYDGVIIRNWRVGRHQQLGDVVVPKNGNQIKLTSNANPTESEDIRFSTRQPNQTAEEFFRKVVNEFKSNYASPAPVKMVTDLSNKESLAKQLGINPEEISDEQMLAIVEGVEKGNYACFMEDWKRILLFVDENVKRSEWIEYVLLHEVVHAVDTKVKGADILGAWLWDNAKGSVLSMCKKNAESQGLEDIKESYREMLAETISFCMEFGMVDELLEVLPNEELRKVVNKIVNKIGYDTRTETEIRRRPDSFQSRVRRRDGIPSLVEGFRQEESLTQNEESRGNGVLFSTEQRAVEEVVDEGLILSVEDFTNLAINIYKALHENIRRNLVEIASRNDWKLRDAILQMPTSLAMKNNLTDEEVEAAKVIAQKVEDAIVNSGVELARPLTTDEALWMLYRASNPISESNPFAMAERAVVADHLGFSPKAKEADKVGEDDIRFRKYISYQVASAAEAYSDAVAYWGNRMNEAFVDQFDSVDQMMKAIEEATGKKAETWEDVRLILTQTASKGFAKLQEVEQTLIQKMWDAVNAFANEGVSYERLSRYVILKHGLERNELFAKRDARRSYEEEYHSEVKRIKNDPTLTDAEKQQQMDDAKVVLDNHIADINAQTDARYLENRKTDYSGIRAMFADYPGLMSSDNYNTEEEYRTARRKARKLRYKKLDYAEAEAQMECDDFEAGRGALVKDLWDSINNLTKGTLKMQYDYGMLSSEAYKNLTGMFKYYVPLRGFSDNTGEDLYDYYSHNTSDGYAPAVIGAKGRKSEAESPFGWMAAMAATAIVSGEKNAAKQALYYFVMNRRANDLLKVADVWYVQSPSDADTYYPEFPPMADPNKTTAENAQQYADWENQMEDLRRQGKAVKKTNRLDIAGVAKFGAREVPEHIIKVNIAGEEKQLILNANPRAAQAINGLLNIEGNPDYQKVLGKILRWMSQVSTGWNPEFWMTNISRDTITAFSAVGIKEDKIYNEAWRKNWVEAWKIVKLLPKLKDGTLGTGRLEDLLREAVENGVQTGYSHIKSMEEWDKDMNKYLKELNKDEAKVVRAIKKGIDKVQTFSESMELVSRFATYLTSRQMGRDIVRSVADAKEVTVNFNRKGSGMRITFDEAKKLKWADGTPIFSEKWKGSQRLKGLLSVAYVSGISALAPFGRKYMMFFNAGIQGVNMWLQMYRKGYGRQVNTLAGAAFALGMLNSIIQGILDGDDNEYQESISDYERRSNLMIGAKGYYVKIALPQELKAFYGLADILYNYGAGNYHHKDAPVEVLKTMTNQLMEIMPINPMGGWQEFIPSFATATIEAGVAIPFLGEPIKGTNKNFAGSPLRDEKPWLSDAERESMPKYAFASNNTWNWLVDLAELANRATGGTKYDAGWLQLDPARIQHYTEQATGGIGGFVGKLTSTINAAFDSEKDVEVANIPFLNKMFTVADERSKNKLTNQQFYYYKGVAEAAEMRYSNYSKEGDKDSRKKERSSDEFKIMKVYYKYDGREEMYRNKLKRARTSAEEKEIKAKRDASRKEFINELADKGLL